MQLHRTFIITAALAATTAIAAPRVADACGGYGDPLTQAQLDQRTVRATVSSHLAAVRRGDAKQLNRLWAHAGNSANVVRLARSGKRVVSVTAMKRSIARWARTPDKNMKWNTQKIRVNGDRATVSVQIQWHGSKLDEQLTLAKQDGVWHLVGKRYRITAAARVSAY